MAGRRLMLQMAKPRKAVLADDIDTIPFDAIRVQEMDAEGWEVYEAPDGRHIAKIQWWNAPEKRERLGEYCRQDSDVERQLESRLRPLQLPLRPAWRH